MFFDGEVLWKPMGQYMFLPQRVEFGGSAKNYLPRIGEFFKPNAIEIFRKDFSKTEDHSTLRKRPGKMIFYIRQFHILNPLNQIIFNGSNFVSLFQVIRLLSLIHYITIILFKMRIGWEFQLLIQEFISFLVLPRAGNGTYLEDFLKYVPSCQADRTNLYLLLQRHTRDTHHHWWLFSRII